MLVGRQRLTGEHRLIDGQRAGRQDAGVGGHPVSGGQLDDISGHDPGGRDALHGALPPDLGHRRAERAQRAHRLIGLGFLADPDDDVDRQNGEDGRALGDLAQHHQGDQPGDQQQDRQRIGELAHRAGGQRRRLGRWERVGPVLGQQPRGGLLRQTRPNAHVNLFHELSRSPSKVTGPEPKGPSRKDFRHRARDGDGAIRQRTDRDLSPARP
nr:hypothetical protein GCM10020093_019410 [Planobispora longispora]